MNRTRVRPISRATALRRRRTVAVLVALMLAVPVAATAAGNGTERDLQRYTVRPGDTLWSIAQAHGESDPSDLVDAISRENPQASSLVPGQILHIPSQ